MAMSMLVSFAPGIRVKERRCRVESTMATFMGTLIEAACRIAAAVAMDAACSVSVGSAVAAGRLVDDEVDEAMADETELVVPVVVLETNR